MVTGKMTSLFLYFQLLKMKANLAGDLVKCLNSCSLPAVSNEVYQMILKHLKWVLLY